MKPAPIPDDDRERLERLHALGVIDTPAEERFDRYTRLARRLFDVPIALVSLVDLDRQWFKSRDGLEAQQSPRETSFCGHAIHSEDLFVIRDTERDPRFADNPFVTATPGIRFYAGCPIGGVAGGSALGTLCILDHRPRAFTEEDATLLRDLGAMVTDELTTVELATTDALTGISNRRGFVALSERTLAQAKRAGHEATLLYFDLDGLKALNDRDGHAAGDLALKTFANALTTTFRSSDVIGRLGGDEYAVILSRVGRDAEASTSAAPASGVVDMLIARLQRTLAAADGPKVRCSVGAAHFDPKAPRPLAALLAEADGLMYAARRAARGDATVSAR